MHGKSITHAAWILITLVARSGGVWFLGLLCSVLGLVAQADPSGDFDRLLLAQCGPEGCFRGGQPPVISPAEQHPAVVRLGVVGRFSRVYGSGTVVACDERGAWVLSCAHLFGERTIDTRVYLADGRVLSGRVVAVDRAWDLSLIWVEALRGEAVPLADEPPAPGQSLHSCGYGSDGRYVCNRGNMLGYVARRGLPGHQTLLLSGTAREGDSGGPVFNERGELVGVLWGTDGRTVLATYCGKIRQFLREAWARLGGGPIGPKVPEVLPGPEAPPLEPVAPQPVQPPAPAPKPDRSLPPLSAAEIAEMRGKLDRLAEQLQEADLSQARSQQALSQRLQQLEGLVTTLAGLRDRVEEAEKAVGAENLRAVVRDVALGVLAERASPWTESLLLKLLAALGWTGPPSIAAVLAARAIAVVVRRGARRVQRRLREKARAEAPMKE